MVWLTQSIFYGACWLNWESNGLDRQAILFDIAHEKLYLFGLVLWPQDSPLLAFVLILAATALFFVRALAGDSAQQQAAIATLGRLVSAQL